MQIALAIMMLVGLTMWLAGSIWLLLVGFRSDVLWGLILLFIPCSPFVFVCYFWKEGRVPFFLTYAGMTIFGSACCLLPPAS